MSLLDPVIGFGSKQRDFVNAKRAYKHRYRWAMKDMKAAGLNPILVASQGIAGSFGSVSGSVGSTGEGGLNKSINTAMSGMRLKQELSNMRANEQLTQGLYAKSIADRLHSTASAEQAQQGSAESRLRQIQMQLDQPRLKNAAAHATEMGIWGPRIDRVLKAAPAIGAAVGGFFGGRFGVKNTGTRNPKRLNNRPMTRAEQIENQARR